ncbi:Rho GTPase-activating protein 20, partial [Trichinella papuae]
LYKTMNKESEKYLKEGRISFVSADRIEERYVFLFTDTILIAKEKALNTFCLKEKMHLKEIWISEKGMESISDCFRRSDSCFIIGWPGKNFILEFSCPEEKNNWLAILKTSILHEKLKERPRKALVTVQFASADETWNKELLIDNLLTSSDLIKELSYEFHLSDTDSLQLFYTTEQHTTPVPLEDFEIPYEFYILDLKSLYQSSNSLSDCNDSVRKRRFGSGIFLLKPKIDNARNRRTTSSYASQMMIHWKKKSNNYNKHVGSLQFRRQGKFFGKPLATMVTDQSMCPMLEKIFDHLYKSGITTEGIFRKPPKQITFREVKEQIDAGIDVNVERLSPTVSASLLKEFLRLLPDSLFTSSCLDKWLSLSLLTDNYAKLQTAQKLISNLPAENKFLLNNLMCLCYCIVENCAANHMDSYSLSICLGPGLFHPAKQNTNLCTLNARRIAEVTKFIIDNVKILFENAIRIFIGKSSTVRKLCSDNEQQNDTHESNQKQILAL